MIYENDKIEIPEKYRNMSVSELRKEKERIYQTLNTNRTDDARKKKLEGVAYRSTTNFVYEVRVNLSDKTEAVISKEFLDDCKKVAEKYRQKLISLDDNTE